MNKFSQKREAIYDCIKSTKCHPSAEWVYTQLKPNYPDLSLATVYRNINLFKQQKLIITVANVNGQERVDANTDPHTHFICDSCGSVIDVDVDIDNQHNVDKIQDKYGFKVNAFDLLFRGTCEICKK